jgi:thiol-disulfide isomerase/thioredoxin
VVVLLALVGTWLGAVPVFAAEPASGWWRQWEARSPEGAAVDAPGRWVVLVFLSPECPLANAAAPVLEALVKEFAPRGFSFIGICADPAISPATLRQHAKDYGFSFPLVDDRAHRIVRATGAAYTPEVFVFSREGSRLYRGRIDDRVGDFGEARPAATRQDLREVLTALAAGQSGPFADHAGFGCAIPQPVK